MRAARRLAWVCERCSCAIARCAGASLDRCAFVVATADRRGWRFARTQPLLAAPRPPPEVPGVGRRFLTNECGLECL